MKKILFTMIAVMAAITMQAAITVHVKADKAPHIWAWTNAGNVFDSWPGPAMTEKKTIQGTEFWYYTFDASITSVSVLFNDGGANGPIVQTRDFNGITTDRFFVYDGESGIEDVTTQYGGEIPDAKVESLTLKGNHDNWAADVPFTVVEAGKTFELTYDLAGNTVITDGYWLFKIRPNGQDWVGYSDATVTAPSWCEEARTDGNFQIDFEEGEGLTSKIFTITATWAGGKEADKGWSVTIINGASSHIAGIVDNAKKQSVRYNLSGQRISSNYRGIVVVNGKKMMAK